MQTAKEVTHTSKNQREITFDLHLLLPPGTGAHQAIPQPLAQRAVLVLGVARGDVNRSN